MDILGREDDSLQVAAVLCQVRMQKIDWMHMGASTFWIEDEYPWTGS
jgi:hypothetical protein